MKKSIRICAWLTISFLLFFASMNCVAATWIEYGNYDISWYSTSKKNFSLKNAQEVAGLSYLVNNKITSFKGCTFQLENDISLYGKDWIPIGNATDAFEGDFDGNGHRITGVNLSKYDSDYIGFFGNIKNNHVRNFYIGGTIRMRDKASIRCGLVSGKSVLSTIENIEVSVSVYLDYIVQHEYVDWFWEWYHGGVVGDSEYSDFISIKSDVHIEDNIGGQQKNISDINRSVFMGGIVGRMKGGSVCKCIANGDYRSHVHLISSEGIATKEIVGGIVGIVENSKSSDSKPYKITSCSATNTVYGYYSMAYYSGNFSYSTYYFTLGGILGSTREDTETKFLNSKTQIECCVAINKKIQIDGYQTNYISTRSTVGGILGSVSKYQPAIFSSNFSNSDCETVYEQVRNKLYGVNGFNTYTANRMQTQSFINEINQLNYLKFGEEPWFLDGSGNISLKDIGPTTLITNIELNKTSDELEVGKTTQLTATVYPTNATNKAVNWTSSNSSVATVSTSGLVTAKGVGTATITCSAKDSGNAKATCTIKVTEKEVKVTRIELNKTSDELEVGKTTQLTATVYPSNATNKAVTWTSSNSSVAAVSTSGFVTAKGVGTATITCSAKDSGNAKATCTIKVKAKDYIEYNGIRYKVLENNNLSVTPLEKGKYQGDIVIPASVNFDGIQYDVSEIGVNAFYQCINLTSVTIPTSVTSIGDFAFSSCFGLTAITLPEGVTSIGDEAFSSCFSLTRITIPEGVTSIGDYAFFCCEKLSSVILSGSIKTIGKYAFSWSDNLSKIYYNTNTPIFINYETFDAGHYANATLYVPAESIIKFKQTMSWKYFSKIEAHEFSSVEAVIADSEPPVYFDLQGLRVETPVKGRLYIRLQNGKAEKVFIK